MTTPGQSPGQAAVGVHCEIEKAMFGFPLEFIPCLIQDGNDKLRHYPPSIVMCKNESYFFFFGAPFVLGDVVFFA